MEEMKKAIERFLNVGYGSGSGSGSGDGYGDGDGYGYGYGSGSGSGDGYGDGLKSFNGKTVYMIDGVSTVIEQVKGNLAKGFIVHRDLTTEKCCVVKQGRFFAHGATIKQAEESLREKIFADMDTDEKIDAFLSEFKQGVKYPAKAFYEWHNKLTGSCEFGRNAFVRDHGIDLENGMYTVEEFIEITKNDFGGEIIQQIEERINE